MTVNDVIKALKRMGVVIIFAAVLCYLLICFEETMAFGVIICAIIVLVGLVLIFVGLGEILDLLRINTEQQSEILEKLNEKSEDE